MTERSMLCQCAGCLLYVSGIDYDAIPEFLRAEKAAGRRVIELGDAQHRSQAAVHIRASSDDHLRWRQTVAATGAPSGLDQRSVACFDERMALAIGPFVVCLAARTGELLWTTLCDEGGCFGVYALPHQPALIVHGEQDITKLSLDGTTIWRSSGRDIFTGPFELKDEGIRAVDFEGAVYWIRLDTGESEIIGQGEPPWAAT